MAPQTLVEFIHVVTDSKRMPQPLPMADAVSRVENWWNAEEVVPVFPNREAVNRLGGWLRIHRLGRRRLLDTLLAATLFENGIQRLITNNEADYRVLNCFEILSFKER